MELPDHLVGRSVTQICRAADMLCIGIGSVVESTYYRDLNEFDILCRCAWRLRRKSGGLIVADADLFTLNAEEEDGEETLFDEKIGHFLEEEPFLEVTDAAASSAGDLTVELNDDILLEIFADSSSEVCWRILARGENADLRLSSEGGALCALQVVANESEEGLLSDEVDVGSAFLMIWQFFPLTYPLLRWDNL